SSTFFGIHFMFMRFEQVKGYAYPEVLVCFAIVLMQFSLAEMFARGFDTFAGIVRRGEFDRVLVRPRSTILQVLGAKFELSRLGRMFQATLIFIYAMTNGAVVWTPGRMAALGMMLLGGMALFSTLFLLYAAFCFFTLEGLEFMNVFTDGGREYGKYPVDVYGKRILQFSTVIIPYALVQYYPLQYLLGRSDNWLYALCPLGAGIFLLAAYALWRVGVMRYTSSGS
ncbi:MAG: ABC-2 family transporter protein, partial [Clostridia bacterium]|nr:ABC-2 family transporter protein [Clostridia bacterium]